MKGKIALIIFLLIILLCGLFALNYVRGLEEPFDAENNEEIILEVPMGSSTGDIAEILKTEGVIGDSTKFKLFSRFNDYDGNYQAGVYALSPSMTPKEICDIISSGKTAAFTFTIPEGYTVDEIIDTIAATGRADKTILKELIYNGDFSEYEFLNHVPNDANPMEGYLFPDTYLIPYGSSERDIICAMLDRFNDVFQNDILNMLGEYDLPWEGEDSLHGILTIASIIEKETIHKVDKPLVSSVIYNRLEDGMPLRMDTTVIYAMGEHKVDLTYDDIEIESPYNTYLYEGLPIGPICCPGIDSIEAAISPEETDYMYFVVSDKGDGSIKFSVNDWEFEEDKAAYYASREDDN